MTDAIEVREVPSLSTDIWREVRLALRGHIARAVASRSVRYGALLPWKVYVVMPELYDTIETARIYHALLGRAIEEAERLQKELEL